MQRVLLVDDNPGDVELTSIAFEESGLPAELQAVTSGGEAMALLARLVDEDREALPEVILLDLNLGDGTGHDLLPFLKNVEPLSSIPVVILTTSDSDNDRFRATKLGANDYMVKPNSFAEFVVMIQRLAPILDGRSAQLAPA